VLGLEVVLADGRVWDGLKVLRKDNRGYDLKQLFIGSEGTLGIITAAAFKLFPKPSQTETALIALRRVEDAMELYAQARRACSDLISAFELIMRDGIDIALAARKDLTDPFPSSHQVYVLIETASAGRINLRDLLEGLLEDAGDLVEDGVIAASSAQSAQFWLLREMMVEAQGRGGRYLRTDVSVPLARLAGFVSEAHAAVREKHPSALPLVYGHLGDGNIHLNVIPPPGLAPTEVESLFRSAENIIFAVVDRFGGSISAEHGIGLVKQKAFLDRVDHTTLDLASRIKDALDPRHILSNGRILAPVAPKQGS
jgi:FAD/FMN-containing dehydrogenase